MAQQIPTSDTSLSDIDINDKRYPRPKWLSILRSTWTPDKNGNLPGKINHFWLIFFLYAFILEIFAIVAINFKFSGIVNIILIIVVVLALVLALVPSIRLSILFRNWALTDYQQEIAVLLERKRKQRKELEELPLPPGVKLRRKLIGHAKWVQGLAWSLNGETLASWSGDGTVRLWNTKVGRLLNVLSEVDSVESAAWSLSGRTLATGSNKQMQDTRQSEYTIRTWNARTGEPVRSLRGHSAPIQTVVWSPDGKMLASGSKDKSIRTWSTLSGQPLHTSRLPGSVYSITWSPDGQTLAIGCGDKTVRLWDVQSGQLLHTLMGHASR